VLDHVVFGAGRFVSLGKEQGSLPAKR
jgi:hypothetical protein